MVMKNKDFYGVETKCWFETTLDKLRVTCLNEEQEAWLIN